MDYLDFSRIKCIAYDFDGVMTDNRVLISEDGKEAVFCNRSDGLAVSLFRDYGFRQVIISTEKNPVVEKRAQKLGIEAIYGIGNKGTVLSDYCINNEFELENVLFIGNDLNDIPAFEIVGWKGAPADAIPALYQKADWKSSKKGGYGVIRDLYDEYMHFLENEL